jgi:hypothetical protein
MFNIDSPFSMVVLIVLISVSAGVITQYLKLRHSKPDPADTAHLDDMHREIGLLRERVKTLEKIVTNKDEVLAREINRL